MPTSKRESGHSKQRIDLLIDRVCCRFNVTRKQLDSKTRLADIVEPRKILMYIINKEYGLGCDATGGLFNRHHATVLHASKSIAGFMEFDKDFRNTVNNLI
jgi:chromosomal replication initiator protein